MSAEAREKLIERISGDNSHMRQPEHRERMREAISGENNPMRNPDTIAKMVEAKRGFKHSQEAKDKMSASRKGTWTPERNAKREETKRLNRMLRDPGSVGADGKALGNQQRKILDTLKVRSEGMTCAALAEQLGFPKKSVESQINNLKKRGLTKVICHASPKLWGVVEI